MIYFAGDDDNVGEEEKEEDAQLVRTLELSKQEYIRNVHTMGLAF